MQEKFNDEKVIRELPNALINFLWYLWETYCNNEETIFVLSQSDSGESRQTVRICAVDKSITKDFGISINAEILIQKNNNDFCMSFGA